MALTVEIQNLQDDCFLETAVSQGLLKESHARQVSCYAIERSLATSDAALELAILQAYEVEAIRLLCAPGELAPGYQLSSLIGCGAAGMVFRARQERLSRDVALKTINPQSGTAKTTGEPRIQREAHAIARLRHPGIVAAYDSGFHHGRFYIAMELVEGATLNEFIHQEGQVAELTAWRICRQVASALAHASAEGIIHRDIKPANLLLCEPPTGMELPAGVPWVKVADFGLAFDDSSNQITATGASLGTPAYVAPEQLQDSQVGVQADIYSLGATLFHMLTGKPPCVGQSPMKTIMQKSVGDQRWREELRSTTSEVTYELFLEMTEADTTQRIPDYRTLIDRIDCLIEDISEGRPAESRSVSHSKTPSSIKSMGWRRIVAGLILASIGLLAVAGFVNAVTSSRSNPAEQESKQFESSDWTVAGVPRPLFNGKSVPSFRKSGTWLPREASDGSRVLAGLQGARMTLPLSGYKMVDRDLRLRMNISPSTDSSVHIELNTKDRDVSIGKLIIVDGYAEFERGKSGDRKTVQLPSASSEGPLFYQLSVFRVDDQIAIVVDGNSVVSLHAGDGAPELAIICSEGATDFADIDVVQLEPAA